jgi:hypothetical protein
MSHPAAGMPSHTRTAERCNRLTRTPLRSVRFGSGGPSTPPPPGPVLVADNASRLLRHEWDQNVASPAPKKGRMECPMRILPTISIPCVRSRG